MQVRVTPKRALLGLALALVFALQTFGNISRGRWSLAFGVLFGIGAVVITFSLAFTAQRPGAATSENPVDTLASPTGTRGTQVRNHLLIWVGSVLVLIILFKILDTLHVPWREWFR
jgi:multisubunit Na+/H+ antiporter MnhB subunit